MRSMLGPGWTVLALVLAMAGCRRAPGPVDPMRPDELAACPEGRHLAIALAAARSDLEQALLRYDGALRPCRGAVVPSEAYGTIASVGGLSDGTDLVGFAARFGRGGRVVRFREDAEIARVEDEEHAPIAISALAYEGQPAVAVVWGGRSSSDSGERLDVYAESDLSLLGTWEVSYELVRVAPAASAQPGRIAAVIGGGLQEYRSDPGATTLATTGELQVARPRNSGYLRSLDVHDGYVRVASDRGVLWWRAGMAPAFLGPVHCRWGAFAGTPLPDEEADYVAAVIDRAAPDESLVLVSGELRGGSESRSHLYRVMPRGECELIASIPNGYRAIALAWSEP